MAADRPRAVILGASNVTRCAATVATTAAALRGTPLELLVAAGRGRSYGGWSRVLARALPSILESGLWRCLETGPRPTHALVTDVGNDILYGHDPRRILGWVTTCVQRLEDLGAAVTVARLPMDRLRRLGPRTYACARRVLVPGAAPLPFGEAMRRIEALDEGLASMARSRGAALVAPEGAWYGVDPIHIRRSRRAEAWRTLLSGWAATPPPASAVCTAPRRFVAGLALALVLPQHGTMCGIRFGRPDGPPGSVRIGDLAVRLF